MLHSSVHNPQHEDWEIGRDTDGDSTKMTVCRFVKKSDLWDIYGLRDNVGRQLQSSKSCFIEMLRKVEIEKEK